MGGGGGGYGGGYGKGKRKGGMGHLLKQKTRSSPEICVWIGGLESVKCGHENSKKLKEHFKNLGCEPKYAEIMHKNAGAIFTTKEEAAAAIAAVNGSEFMG